MKTKKTRDDLTNDSAKKEALAVIHCMTESQKGESNGRQHIDMDTTGPVITE